MLLVIRYFVGNIGNLSRVTVTSKHGNELTYQPYKSSRSTACVRPFESLEVWTVGRSYSTVLDVNHVLAPELAKAAQKQQCHTMIKLSQAHIVKLNKVLQTNVLNSFSRR